MSFFVKMLMTLEKHKYFDRILLSYTFSHCLDTCIQNDDEALLSISLGHGWLVKMLIFFEPHGIVSLKFCLLIHFKVVFGISNKVK